MAQAPVDGSCLTVLGGPHDGRRFALGISFEELLIGSDSSCEICLDLPGVSPVHAKLLVEAAGVTVSDTRSPFGLFVNDEHVTTPTALREGDVIWLGAPGAATSVMLLCHIVPVEVPVVAPLPGGGAPPMEMWDTAPVQPDAADVFFVEPSIAQAAAEDAAGAVPVPRDDEASFYVEDTPTPATADDGFFVVDDPELGPAVAGPVAAPSLPPVSEPPALDLGVARPATPPAAVRVPPLVRDAGLDTTATAGREVSAADEMDAAFFVEIEPPPAPTGAPPAAPPAPAPRAAAPPAPRTESAPATPKRPPTAAAGAPGTTTAPAARPAAPPASPPVVRPSAPSTAKAAPATAVPPSAPAAGVRRAPEAPPAPVAPRRPRVTTPATAPAAVPAGTAAPAAPTAPPLNVPAPTPAAVPPATAPRTAPSPRGPTTPAAAPTRRATAPPSARGQAASRGTRGRGVLVAAAVGCALIAGLGGWLGWTMWSTPRLDSVTPARASSGQVVTLSGARFKPGAQVLFSGQPGRVVKLDPGRIQVEVPVLSLAPGPDRPVGVVVRSGARSSGAVTLQTFIAPRLHGISPDVALPGETVELAGTGWGPDAVVRFGDVQAQVLGVDTESLRVRVPSIGGPPGTAAPVTVVMGGATSNPAPFFVGRVPLVIAVQPATAGPGDTLKISGRGFRAQPGTTQVELGGRPALILSATDSELVVVVPWGSGSGTVALSVRVSGLEPVGEGRVQLPPPTSNVDFRFAAEPLEEAPDGTLAAVATELGPAFVLAASGGRSAAQRAHAAAQQLNQAAVALKASLSAELEVRFGKPPALGLRGRPEALLSASEEDAAAYSQAGRRPVSAARLAAWWTAVARDLVLLLVRSERPHFAGDLATEGRALVEAFQAGRRAAPWGLARETVEGRPLRAALRALALRVPASVPEPALNAPGAPASAAGAASAELKLEGAWGGREQVPEGRRLIGVTFDRRGGTFTLEGGLTLSVPLLSITRPQRDSVRFSLQLGGGVRYYSGRWDGARIQGSVSADAAGREPLGSFELVPR